MPNSIQAVSILEHALKSNTSWFTGIQIKNILKKTVFSLTKNMNQKIQTGQWSAYAHISIKQSLQNIIKKSITTNETLLIDPFFRTSFLEVFQDYTTSVFDLDRFTLAPDLPSINTDLVILFIQNGATKHYETLLKQFPNQQFLLVIETPVITHNIAHLATLVKKGGVIFVLQQNPLTTWISSLSVQEVTSAPFVLSFFIEQQITMSPEYHLSEAIEPTKQVLDELYVLASTKSNSSITDILNRQVQKTLYGVGKTVKSHKSIDIKNTLKTIQEIPLPDPLIEIIQPILQEQLNISEAVLSQKYTHLYTQLLDMLPNQEEGTLMIPSMDTSETYTKLLFFTTNIPKWKNTLYEWGYNEIATFPKTRLKLSNTKFIEHYGMLVSLL